jgi:hypothetical protein
MGGRIQNGLTDNFTLAVYMQFLVAADTDNSRPRQTSDYPSLTLFSSCQDIIKRAVPIIPLIRI